MNKSEIFNFMVGIVFGCLIGMIIGMVIADKETMNGIRKQDYCQMSRTTRIYGTIKELKFDDKEK